MNDAPPPNEQFVLGNVYRNLEMPTGLALIGATLLQQMGHNASPEERAENELRVNYFRGLLDHDQYVTEIIEILHNRRCIGKDDLATALNAIRKQEPDQVDLSPLLALIPN